MKRVGMNFSNYMQQWLYGEDGYYASFKEIGKAGDFYTSVSVSQFFGGSIAKHIVSQVEKGELPLDATVCEIGAHKGYLLADIIQFIYTLKPELLSSMTFAIIERFDHLRTIQKEYFQASFSDAITMKFYDDIANFKAEHTFFVANEIFDAFPCELLHEQMFARVGDDHTITFDQEKSDLLEKAKKYKKVRGEIAIGYEEFAQNMVKSSKKFEFVTFDYGEKEARPDFSIRVYQKHEVFPLFDENLQLDEVFKTTDITYDVNFTHVIDAYEEAGATVAAYQTQLVALVEFGIMDLLEMVKEKKGDKAYAHELERVKQLISPSFLGERFKMVRFVK
jgi:SAM-dependent MidA family methyltransferase